MELIVLLGIVSVIYGAAETWNDIKPYLVTCTVECRRAVQILTATLKSSIRRTIKHLDHPFYRYSTFSGVHSHKMNSFNYARHSRHLR